MKKLAAKTPWFLIVAALALLGPLVILTWSPAEVEGKDMPGTIVIKYIQDQYGPVKFDHAKHVSMSEGCGSCHHQHNDKMKATCSECHSLGAGAFKQSVKGTFTACSACHSEYSPDMPGMPGLKVAFHKTCFQCHVGIGELGSSPAGCAQTCHSRKSAEKAKVAN